MADTIQQVELQFKTDFEAVSRDLDRLNRQFDRWSGSLDFSSAADQIQEMVKHASGMLDFRAGLVDDDALSRALNQLESMGGALDSMRDQGLIDERTMKDLQDLRQLVENVTVGGWDANILVQSDEFAKAVQKFDMTSQEFSAAAKAQGEVEEYREQLMKKAFRRERLQENRHYAQWQSIIDDFVAAGDNYVDASEKAKAIVEARFDMEEGDMTEFMNFDRIKGSLQKGFIGPLKKEFKTLGAAFQAQKGGGPLAGIIYSLKRMMTLLSKMPVIGTIVAGAMAIDSMLDAEKALADTNDELFKLQETSANFDISMPYGEAKADIIDYQHSLNELIWTYGMTRDEVLQTSQALVKGGMNVSEAFADSMQAIKTTAVAARVLAYDSMSEAAAGVTMFTEEFGRSLGAMSKDFLIVRDAASRAGINVDLFREDILQNQQQLQRYNVALATSARGLALVAEASQLPSKRALSLASSLQTAFAEMDVGKKVALGARIGSEKLVKGLQDTADEQLNLAGASQEALDAWKAFKEGKITAPDFQKQLDVMIGQKGISDAEKETLRVLNMQVHAIDQARKGTVDGFLLGFEQMGLDQQTDALINLAKGQGIQIQDGVAMRALMESLGLPDDVVPALVENAKHLQATRAATEEALKENTPDKITERLAEVERQAEKRGVASKSAIDLMQESVDAGFFEMGVLLSGILTATEKSSTGIDAVREAQSEMSEASDRYKTAEEKLAAVSNEVARMERQGLTGPGLEAAKKKQAELTAARDAAKAELEKRQDIVKEASDAVSKNKEFDLAQARKERGLQAWEAKDRPTVTQPIPPPAGVATPQTTEYRPTVEALGTLGITQADIEAAANAPADQGMQILAPGEAPGEAGEKRIVLEGTDGFTNWLSGLVNTAIGESDKAKERRK